MFTSTWRLLRTSDVVIVQSRKRFASSDVLQSIKPLENCDTKVLKVAIIGMPNAGKSTFINSVMDRKVCAASSKIHTTRSKATAIFSQDETQIVFVDTPGIVNDREQKKYSLEKTFIRDSKNVSKNADIIGVIHDVKDSYNSIKLDIKIIKLLEYNKITPSFLVLNKVDLLKSKRKLLDLTRQLTDNCLNGKPIPGAQLVNKEEKDDRGWQHFREIFMISALNGDGIEDVKQYLVRNAKPGAWLFPEDVWTDQTAEEIITKSVQAKLLDFLPQEIPYRLKPILEYFNVGENGIITAYVTIDCPNDRVSKLVSGAGDGKIRQIAASVQKDLQDTFHSRVTLRLHVDSVKHPS